MMAQDLAESTSVTISYVSFINKFPPDTVKSIRQLQRSYTKICRQNMSILFNEKYIRGAFNMFPDFLYRHLKLS